MTNRRTHRLAVLALVWPMLLLTACSSPDHGSSSGAAGSRPAYAAGPDSAADSADAKAAVAQSSQVRTRSVIATGTVDLRSSDIARVRDRIVALTDRLGGFLADEDTSTDTSGRARQSHLELRVPSAGFDTAMSRVGELGTLVRAKRSAKDVTTQVIDVDQRVRAQRIGLDRLETLLGRAGKLSDVLAVEQQITQRRGELDSLRSQQAYLRSQTSLATISVHLERSAPAAGHQTRTGFGYGLAKGWHGLTRVTVGAVTALGALLPFAVVLLVLAAPVALIRRRRPAR